MQSRANNKPTIIITCAFRCVQKTEKKHIMHYRTQQLVCREFPDTMPLFAVPVIR